MRARNLVLSTVLALSSLAACGGPLKFALRGAQKAPDADAQLVARVDSAASLTRITIEAQHLAPPERIEAGASAFAVWARKSDSAWQRVGGLDYDAGDRVGHLKEASVPLTSFELIVTVEKDNAAAQPSEVVIFSQSVN